ncbi:hypothetical protein [Sphaerospermopsis sp. LEGE 08334]|uniref:hypothetical protein n=1 Tax=Sphaerospermopsis sp. LEGE 08334 TaxID=1828651 RepID=UPI00187F0080|nr:hypothetical protein [Sphaerospermopsis sp. LEGE 08334]MBE9059147.1 hypothetical protein [Sphaerospermopsis sp. LEGE 08334]
MVLTVAVAHPILTLSPRSRNFSSLFPPCKIGTNGNRIALVIIHMVERSPTDSP